MYQWDAEEHGRWDATHNPFSGVVPEDEALLTTASGDLDDRSPDDPAGRARAMQYDVALNGWELGGGSVRIWTRDLLARSFNLQGYTREQMQERFGAMLEAFEYGAPPHGGIALGIDRWAALLSRPDEHPRGHGVPQDPVGLRPRCSRRRPRPTSEQYQELGLRFVGVPERPLADGHGAVTVRRLVRERRRRGSPRSSRARIAAGDLRGSASPHGRARLQSSSMLPSRHGRGRRARRRRSLVGASCPR